MMEKRCAHFCLCENCGDKSEREFYAFGPWRVGNVSKNRCPVYEQ